MVVRIAVHGSVVNSQTAVISVADVGATVPSASAAASGHANVVAIFGKENAQIAVTGR